MSFGNERVEEALGVARMRVRCENRLSMDPDVNIWGRIKFDRVLNYNRGLPIK